jgi:hypothetical protein
MNTKNNVIDVLTQGIVKHVALYLPVLAIIYSGLILVIKKRKEK